MPAPKIWSYDVVMDFKINSIVFQTNVHTHTSLFYIPTLLGKTYFALFSKYPFQFLSLLDSSNTDPPQENMDGFDCIRMRAYTIIL